jgi:hypothetical protein
MICEGLSRTISIWEYSSIFPEPMVNSVLGFQFKARLGSHGLLLEII